MTTVSAGSVHSTVGLLIAWGGICATSFSQPTGTFRIDGAVNNKHAHEVSSAAASVAAEQPQLHIVCCWNDYRLRPADLNPHIGVVITTDGFAARTEYADNNAQGFLRPILNLPSGNQSIQEFDPMSASEPLTKDLYVGGVWRTSAAPETGIFVARNPANQTTAPHFSQVVSIIRDPLNPSQGFPVNTADKPWMAVGRRHEVGHEGEPRIYVCYNQFTTVGLSPGPNITSSIDHGLTWTTPAPIPLSAGTIPQDVTGPLPRVGPDGMLYVSMYEHTTGKILFQRSLDGGVTWLTNGPIQIAQLMDFWQPSNFTAGDVRLPGSPSRLGPWACIAIDPSAANKLYCAFIDTTRVLSQIPPNGQFDHDIDIYFCVSTDFGSTWSTPTKKFTSGLTDQFFPWIEVGTTGRIHLTAYDTKRVDNDPVQHDWDPIGYYNNYYRYSDNGGIDWPETRLTSPSWILPCDTISVSSLTFNDYAGMAIADNVVMPAFTVITLNSSQPNPECPRGNGDVYGRIITP